MMYAVSATIETKGKDGYRGMRQIPTFYLDENVQGIVSETHAVKVARDILSSAVPTSIAVTFHITAVRL